MCIRDSQQPLLQMRHRLAVLRMHRANRAEFQRPRDTAQQHAVIDHQGALVGLSLIHILERFFRRPTMAICTDGLMPGPGQKPHPRSLGAFPKALRLARDMAVPLQQMIWRMATLPCRFLNLPNPTLQPGADASLVLFDPDTVAERNDYTCLLYTSRCV